MDRIPLVMVPITLSRRPPSKMATRPIRPTERQHYVTSGVGTFQCRLIVSRGDISHRRFQVRVAGPSRAIAFSTIPGVLLRVRVCHVDADLPGPIRPFIITAG